MITQEFYHQLHLFLKFNVTDMEEDNWAENFCPKFIVTI